MNKILRMSNRVWYRNICFFIIFYLIFFAGMLSVASWLTKKPFSYYLIELSPLLLITFTVVVLFMLLWPKINKSNRPNKKLAEMEDDFKRQLKISIEGNFGKAQYFIINPNIPNLDDKQSDLIKSLLSEISENNHELRYYLFATLGLVNLQNDDPKKAVTDFESAIAQKPRSIICLNWLAETYELVGDSMNAIRIYNIAAMLSEQKSSELFNYFNEQIDIVKKQGPRKLPLITGLRYGTY